MKEQQDKSHADQQQRQHRSLVHAIRLGLDEDRPCEGVEAHDGDGAEIAKAIEGGHQHASRQRRAQLGHDDLSEDAPAI